MITLRIKYDDTTVGIQFPCSDSVIASKLMELHASDHEGDPFFVEEVIEPKELTKFFEHRFVDLDETNYLAKRMESFLPSEMLQFYGAALQEGHLTVKDLINTTFNLGRYTLIRDLTDMHKVGVTHTLNVKGAITPEEQNSPFMETVGKDLICSGFPCQPFSVSGRRLGFADTRAHSFMQSSEWHPQYLFLENVQGVLNRQDEETFETILKAIHELGYTK